MKLIYLDHASSTPLDPRVLNAMLPYFRQHYANPSSFHDPGRNVKEVVERCRKKVAEILQAQPEEIIFTSGGTESINLAIKGVALVKGKGHIITSQIEHPAVLETCKYLERRGFTVGYVKVDKSGMINPASVEKAIRKDTILISIMYANNELGTIQPIINIGKIAQRHQIPFHTDACQAGMLELNVQKLKVDLLTLNGAKIYGPKGIGILYQRKGISLEPLIHGGGQEFNLRSGTENVPGIVGFAPALELIQKGGEKKGGKKETQRLILLRDYFTQNLLNIPGTRLVGHPTRRLPTFVTVAFQDVDAEQLVNYLSLNGIYASSGSACASQNVEQSHVLKAIGLPESWGAVRFSLGNGITKKELDDVAKTVKKIVERLREVR